MKYKYEVQLNQQKPRLVKATLVLNVNNKDTITIINNISENEEERKEKGNHSQYKFRQEIHIEKNANYYRYLLI